MVELTYYIEEKPYLKSTSSMYYTCRIYSDLNVIPLGFGYSRLEALVSALGVYAENSLYILSCE
jgi:hypothetical protein